MDSNKLVDSLTKGLVCVGLAYLTHAIVTMPKELQTSVKGLLDEGKVDEAKQLFDSHPQQHEEKSHESQGEHVQHDQPKQSEQEEQSKEARYFRMTNTHTVQTPESRH